MSSEKVVCPESTVESANRRNFVRRAALLGAAATVGSTFLGSNMIPESSARSCVRSSLLKKSPSRTASPNSCVSYCDPTGTAIYGGTCSGVGVKGHAKACCGVGVVGSSVKCSGVFGRSCEYVGVYGASCNTAVFGLSPKGVGVHGGSFFSTGVYGTSVCSIGVYGLGFIGIGVYGSSCCSYGVKGYSLKSIGVKGCSPKNVGVLGRSCCSYGVEGYSPKSTGVFGESVNGVGVYGESCNSYGVQGYSSKCTGVYGQSCCSLGVLGGSKNSTGVQGSSCSSYGVLGNSAKSTGVFGQSSCSFGVAGYSPKSGGVLGWGCSIGIEGQAAKSSAIPIVAKGASCQSAPLLEWRNSSCTPLSIVNKCGWLGVGAVSAPTTLTVGGSVSAKTVATTANYKMGATDFAVLASGKIKVTLPPASTATGMMVFVKNASTSTVTIDAFKNSSETDTIEGVASKSLKRQYDSLQLISNGTNEWFILSGAICGAFTS